MRGGAQRPVMRINVPKKMGMRQCTGGDVARRNPLVNKHRREKRGKAATLTPRFMSRESNYVKLFTLRKP